MSSWTAKLNTEGDLKSLFDSTNGPGSWDQYMQDPVLRKEADRYLQLNKQHSYFAIQALTDLVSTPGGKGVAARMLTDNPVANQYSNPNLRDMAASHISGQSQYQYDAAAMALTKPAISEAAQQSGIAEPLLMALAQQESNFNPLAVSSAGAEGLMQLMPGTATEMGLRPGEVWDPKKNAKAGAGYLRKMLTLFGGNLEMALEAYNWGPGRDKKGVDHTAAIRAGRVPAGVKQYAADVLWKASRYDETNTRSAKSPGVDPQSGAGPIMNIPDMGNMPGSVGVTLDTISRAKTAGIEGSGYTSREMSTVLPAALNTLNNVAKEGPPLISALQRFFKALSEGEAAAGGGGAGVPQGIPLQ
jgi:soluble lytic murein transglycosylase-like protein